MKRTILLVTLMVTALVAFAQTPPTVICDGATCLCRNIPPNPIQPMNQRNYNYFVQANNPGEMLLDLYVGTDDQNIANYSNWVQPPAWFVMISPYTVYPHNGWTMKGMVSPGPTGSCPAYIYWSAGVPVPVGEFGYDHLWTVAHDVGWEVLTDQRQPPGYRENWMSPVGVGNPLPSGPVHSPSAKYYPPPM